MHDEQYSQIFTNYLIIDTCLFLNSGELIARILISIWLKKLTFKIVVPIVVRLELERQARSCRQPVKTFLSWYRSEEYGCGELPMCEQATTVLRFFDECTRKDIINFGYQGNDETANFHAANNDDLILDCHLFYHQEYAGRATLLSNDWELCAKAELLGVKSIHQCEDSQWQILLRACQVDDIPLDRMKMGKCSTRFKKHVSSFQYDVREFFFRRSQYKNTLEQMETIHIDDLDYLELPPGQRKWIDRPLLISKYIFKQDDDV